MSTAFAMVASKVPKSAGRSVPEASGVWHPLRIAGRGSYPNRDEPKAAKWDVPTVWGSDAWRGRSVCRNLNGRKAYPERGDSPRACREQVDCRDAFPEWDDCLKAYRERDACRESNRVKVARPDGRVDPDPVGAE